MAGLWSRLLAALRPGADDAPVVDQAPGMTVVQVVRRFWPDLRPLRGWILLSLVLLTAGPAIAPLEVLLFQRLVDEVLVPADVGPLLGIAGIYVGLNLLSALVSGGDDYLGTWITQTFLVRMRAKAFGHALSLPLPLLARRRLGDVLQRLSSDVAQVERFMLAQLTAGFSSAVQLIFSVAALFYLSWELALAALVVVPAFWWVSSVFARFVRDLSREGSRRRGALGSVSEEMLGSAALVQTLGAQEEARASYGVQNAAMKRAAMASSRVRVVFLPLIDLVELVGTLVVVGLGVWALSTDRITLGGLLAFMTLLVQCYQPVRGLGELLPQLFAATAGIERVAELLDEQPVADRPGAGPIPRGPGAISLRGVTAAYPGSGRPVVRDLDLEIAAGERVAVVGPSGIGKSTLAYLLTRHLEASSGRVLLDGHDVAAYTAQSVRERVALVLQESLLLDASVRDNLLLARPDASPAQLRAALSDAGALSFVDALPQGIATRIGQRGRMLSGGQRQRLCLARALLRSADVLVLDEPTTGLDDEAARLLLEPLASDRSRTVVLLTHDPRVLAYVDRVVDLGALVSAEPPPTAPLAAGTGASE